MSKRIFSLSALILALMVPLASPAVAERPAKELFGKAREGSAQRAASYGSYAKGCVAGAVQLPANGKTWQAMRLSRNRNWGHPELVDFVQDLSRKAARQKGWEGLYVGDLSQPRGGPMLSGHRSHQIGLDADIWLRAPKHVRLTVKDREFFPPISMQRAKGAYVNSKWTRQHHNILRAAAKDPRVARIFIFPGAKVQMCKDEKGDRKWLRKIRPWGGHHYHFHVRLSCPKGAKGCVNQAPPPKGDGCQDAADWANNILHPKKPDPKPSKPTKPRKPRGPITLSDLPKQCGSVLSSR